MAITAINPATFHVKQLLGAQAEFLGTVNDMPVYALSAKLHDILSTIGRIYDDGPAAVLSDAVVEHFDALHHDMMQRAREGKIDGPRPAEEPTP
jgi:hypothetical protein